jgi:dipeptidase E
MILAVENSNITCNEPSTSIAPIPPHRSSWSIGSGVKGFFAGSANIPMSHPYFAQCVIDLTERPPHEIIVLYIGTATYDIQEYRDIQTSAFFSFGCTIKSLDVDHMVLPFADIEKAVGDAHIVLVSGGNTLYAVDKWRSLGLDIILKEAAHRGTVLTGGSAGLICWFDGGHSDRCATKDSVLV